MNQLRATSTKLVVEPGEFLFGRGFEEQSVTSLVGSGGTLLTATRVRVFRLRCGCVARRLEDCGPSCTDCMHELEYLIELGEQEVLSPTQIESKSVSCKRHSFFCATEFCDRGGCGKHTAQAPDGRYYCRGCFQEREDARRLAEIQEKRGFLASRIWKLVRFFFPDEK